jgi:hypothetical protein
MTTAVVLTLHAVLLAQVPGQVPKAAAPDPCARYASTPGTTVSDQESSAERAKRWVAAQLDLHVTDLEQVTMGPDGAHVRLTLASAEAMRVLTAQNVGQVVRVTIEGMTAVETWAQGEIGSGRMLIPPTELRGRLCQVLRPKLVHSLN